jgi:hypothetical protein
MWTISTLRNRKSVIYSRWMIELGPGYSKGGDWVIIPRSRASKKKERIAAREISADR